MKRLVAVLGSLVVTSGCATAPVRHDVARTSRVHRSYDETWSAVVDVFADHGWAIAQVDKESGIITTPWLNFAENLNPDRYADCGFEPFVEDYPPQMRFNVRVKATDSGASLTVNTTFRKPRSKNASDAATCESRGTVETLIQDEVADVLLNASHPAPVAVPAAAPVEAPPRGFFCSSSASDPTKGICAREKADCQRAFDALQVRSPDQMPCTLVETAWCSGPDCAPTKAACVAQGHREAGADCAEAK